MTETERPKRQIKKRYSHKKDRQVTCKAEGCGSKFSFSREALKTLRGLRCGCGNEILGDW